MQVKNGIFPSINTTTPSYQIVDAKDNGGLAIHVASQTHYSKEISWEKGPGRDRLMEALRKAGLNWGSLVRKIIISRYILGEKVLRPAVK